MLFLDALLKKNKHRPPVWLMRQAGRYMPVYQSLRKRYSLTECFHNPVIASEITCQPVKHLGVDAAILFSDILLILETLNLEVIFPEKGAPYVQGQIQNTGQNTLNYVEETIGRLKDMLSVPLIGFSGGPFTVASYMVKKNSEQPIDAMKNAIEQNPALLHTYLELITEKTISYLSSQIKAGVSALQIFDSWAGLLSPTLFQNFAMPYLDKILRALRGFPILIFTRNTEAHLSALLQLAPSGVSFDQSSSLASLKNDFPFVIQGNLAPEVLLEPPESIVQKTKAMLDAMQGCPRYIANLGHGVLPTTPLEHVQIFVETVKNYQAASGGMEQRIASGFPPERNPNFVPRS